MGKTIKAIIIVVLICLPLLSDINTHVIDELQLISVVGFDKADNDEIRGTVSLTAYSYEEELTNTALTAVSDSTRKLRLLFNSMSSRPLHGGKISSILLQDNLAEEGIFDVLDTYYRDPTIAMTAYLCVVKGTTNEMLNTEFPLQTEIGRYLNNLLDHNMERANLPKSNMHLFIRSYFEKGHDPIMPVLSYNERALRIEGIGLFKRDRLVHELDLNESFFLKLITDGYQTGGSIEVRVEDGSEVAVLRELRSDVDLGVDLEEGRLYADVDLKTRLSEYSGGLLTEEKIKQITKETDDYLKEEITQLLYQMQQLKIDPIGFVLVKLNEMDE
ncbi:Ger(x)C family spore germination protein [Bacillus sp. JCM 19041]|uniref:Ger(x)C family spore germination protein n=1 Tax=Bacillus sp. JCM 19041 TaxID=1460637 RepID=UPI0006D1BD12